MAFGLALAKVGDEFLHQVVDLLLHSFAEDGELKTYGGVGANGFDLATHAKGKVVNTESQFHLRVRG